jgi:GTP pyrophosphokinase
MESTRQHNQITLKYSQDAYLEKLSFGQPVAADSLLRKACVEAWDIPPDLDMPSSLDVALLLSELGCDETTLIVGLLSSTRIMHALTKKQLEKTYGQKISDMVFNVCELHSFHLGDGTTDPAQVEGLRRMLLSMVDDVRVVLIKLAFRVQRLRQLTKTDNDMRRAVARESLDIFAPIANRLGIGQLKWEMEDLSFRYLEPDTYKRIAKYIDEKRGEREHYLNTVVNMIREVLADNNINAKIYGRPKHIYSIWKKMTDKQRGFHELFDVRAVRIVVDSIADCYVVLGLVHALWRHIDKEFDDYIASPKPNGYQSLHTAVHGPEGKPVEVQIRTQQMDEFAEHGIAAHWRYKEGDKADARLQAGIDALRRLLDPEHTEDEELLDNFRNEMFHDRVFVLTPEGRVIDLPQGSTPLDFAYTVHTEIGHRCRGAKINGHIVQLTYELKNGERVEILTSKIAHPSRDWLLPHLGFLKTSRARNRVRSWYRKQDEGQNQIDGKAIYEREIKRQGVRPEIDKLLRHFKLDSAEEFYIAVGRSDISIAQITSVLHELSEAGTSAEARIPLQPKTVHDKNKKSSSHIMVQGVGNLMTTLANCCKPVPGDEIAGFITRGKGVSIHRKDCRNIINVGEDGRQRLIEVSWGDAETAAYPVTLIIDAMDRQSLLSDIANTMSNEKANVTAFNTLSDKKHQTARISVTFDVRDLQQLTRIMDKIAQLPNVRDIMRGSKSKDGGESKT